MTVSAQTPYSSQAANSVTTSFPFAYKIRSNTDIVVVVVDASGVETAQTLGVHYTVSGVGSPTGGSVVFTSAPATGLTVKTRRVTGLARSTDYQNNGDLLAAILNGDVDAVWLALQEFISGTQAPANAVRAPLGEVLTPLVPASVRANKALVFDGSGNVAVSADIASEAAAAAASAATAQAAATQAQTAIPPVQVVDYTALRAYAGTATALQVTGYLVTSAPAGTAGTFTRDDSDTTSTDNGGTIIVASNGKRWKRVYKGPVFAEWFGADPLGAASSAAAIQAAVTSLAASGGEVRLPGRYMVDAQITVSSTKPIALTGPGGGQLYDPSLATSGIVIGANIAGSIIKYVAPVTRSSHGGGRVSGLNFYDATGSGSTPGSYTCTAALELYDFTLSEVDGNTFHWINGSAIKGEFVVMSSIRNNRIRYCGAAGQPALYFPSTNASFPAQACEINSNRVEVCRGDSYLKLGANSSDCKVLGNGFEADTAVAASNQEFLTADGIRHRIFGNHLNRNTGSQMTLIGQSFSVVGNSFAGGAYAVTALTVSGNRNTLTGNTFSSTRTGYEVDITGPYNVFAANSMYFSGAVRVAGAGNSVTANVLNQCTATTAVLGAGDDWWIQESSAVASTLSTISNNTLSNSAGSITTTGGIRARGTTPNVMGNTFNAFAGTGNGAICLRVETTNAVVGGNVEANSTTLISTSGIGSGELFGNYSASGSVLPLTGSAVYDPPSLAAGATQQTTVTATGAVVGDFAMVSFNQANTDIQWSGEVTSNNTVTVTQRNRGAGAVDLASGTLKVRVLKR